MCEWRKCQAKESLQFYEIKWFLMLQKRSIFGNIIYKLSGLYPNTFADLRFLSRIEFYDRRHIGHCCWQFIWSAVSPPCGVQGQCLWKLCLLQRSQVFKWTAFPCIIRRPNRFLFRSPFASVRYAWWLRLPTSTH